MAEAAISVLVVDDDFMVADVHRRLVERQPGCVVQGVAYNGRDALRMMIDNPPDLVLLDIYLPDIGGLEVLRLARQSGVTSDVLVISAARDFATVRSALQLGTFHFLIKPFAPAMLIERLSRYATFRQRILANSEVDQAGLDEAMQLLRVPEVDSPSITKLPKGLSILTMGLIRQVLTTDQDMTANDVALSSGVSRVSARRYLEYLVDIDEVQLRLRYGTSGRPEHMYRATKPSPS